jgi:ATP-dependent exoDNAse (exonuclease V) alpha subunit
MPTRAKYRHYAEVARKLAEQKQGSDRFMWARLALLWDKDQTNNNKRSQAAWLFDRVRASEWT